MNGEAMIEREAEMRGMRPEMPDPKPAEEAPPEYAIVEIFGHRRLAGRVMEVERFGAKLLRIDVPTEGDFAKGFTTQFYGGASLFSVTPTDLASVAKMNKPYEAPRLYHAPADPDDPAGDEPPDE